MIFYKYVAPTALKGGDECRFIYRFYCEPFAVEKTNEEW